MLGAIILVDSQDYNDPTVRINVVNCYKVVTLIGKLKNDIIARLQF